MADITSLISGRTYFKLEDGMAALLLETFPDKFVRYQPKAKAVPPDEFRIFESLGGRVQVSKRWYRAPNLVGGETFYDRAPAGLRAAMPDVPDHIAAAYARAYTGGAE